MFKVLSKIFPTKHEKDVKNMLPIVEEINEHYEGLKDLSDDELRAKTQGFKDHIKSETAELENRLAELKEKLSGDMEHNDRMDAYDEIRDIEKELKETTEAILNDILPEAFAVVKDTCRRLCGKEWTAAGNKIKWNMIPYDVQLIGGIVLHQGKIAEMATGEGKTLVATLPMYLNALPGKGVHLITVNDYLATRDSEWMGEIFKFHGISVGVITNDMNSTKRQEMYNSDITYGTNNEFGFDYLRDNMVVNREHLVQRGHNYAIVDEVDSVLIDEARTPLIISGPVEASAHKFDDINPMIRNLVNAQKTLVSNLVADAERLLSTENPSKEDEETAGLYILRAYHGLPKHKKLEKLLSDPGNKRLMQTTEAYYMRDKAKEMHVVDDELYFVIDEKSHITDLTEKGREYLAPSASQKDFFTMVDLGDEFAQIDNDSSLSEDDKQLKKDEVAKVYAERSDRLHTVQQLLKAYGLYEKDVDYVIADGKVQIVDEFTGRVLSGQKILGRLAPGNRSKGRRESREGHTDSRYDHIAELLPSLQ